MPWPRRIGARCIDAHRWSHAEYMRDWGKHTHGSPLYAELVEVVAEDPSCCG